MLSLGCYLRLENSASQGQDTSVGFIAVGKHLDRHNRSSTEADNGDVLLLEAPRTFNALEFFFQTLPGYILTPKGTFLVFRTVRGWIPFEVAWLKNNF